MARPQLIVDCETTALEPDYRTGRGTIWELAVIERESGAEHLWRMHPDLAAADPSALTVGRFYERTRGMEVHPDRALTFDLAASRMDAGYWSDPGALAAYVARLLDGATIIGAVPSFDAGFLGPFLRHHGHAPTWHYRLRDFGSMAHGYLHGRAGIICPAARGEIPAIDAGTDEFAVALGVDLGRFERHSALGDCRIVDAGLDVIEGPPVTAGGA